MTAVAYQLVLHPRAQRELDRVPHHDVERVDAAVLALRQTPRPMGVQKLEGELHRIRVGDWRVIFAVKDSSRQVVVLRVTRRSEKTYKRLF